MTKEEMKALGYQVIDHIVEHRTHMPEGRVYNKSKHSDLLPFIPNDLPLKGSDPQEVFALLNELLTDHIVHTDHPRFYSFIPAPSDYIGVLADSLAAGFNVFAGHWMAGSAAAMIEKTTIAWLSELFDFPEGSGGIFVSGGSMANLSAIATARHTKLGEDFSKGTIYYSQQTHSSLAKGLRVLGFRRDQMRAIPTTADFTMDLSQLKSTLQKDREVGLTPFCIVGNAGTTNTGAVDDLHALANLAQEEGCWFHIDGAYGAAAILSDSHKSKLSGIERADSLTLDPHKWWFQPFEAGCLLVRDRSQLKQTFQVQAEYLEDTIGEQEEINFYDYGVQLTRSFRALKMYAFLRIKGLEEVARMIQVGIDYAEEIEQLLLNDAHWEIVSAPSLGIIAFRVKVSEDEGQNDLLNKQLSDHLSQSGFAMITTTQLNGQVALRMCPIHPQLTREDLIQTLEKMNEFIHEKTKVL